MDGTDAGAQTGGGAVRAPATDAGFRRGGGTAGQRTASSAQLWTAVNAFAGPVAVVAGVVLSALGWYGVSGESVPAKQIPYLASASIPGAALIIAGAVLLTVGRRDGRTTRADEETARRVAELHALLVEAVGPAAERQDAREPGAPGIGAAGEAAGGRGAVGDKLSSRGRTGYWALPSGTRYHRPTCVLLAGKPEAFPLPEGPAAHPELTPCPVCVPPAPGTPAEAEAERPDLTRADLPEPQHADSGHGEG